MGQHDRLVGQGGLPAPGGPGPLEAREASQCSCGRPRRAWAGAGCRVPRWRTPGVSSPSAAGPELWPAGQRGGRRRTFIAATHSPQRASQLRCGGGPSSRGCSGRQRRSFACQGIMPGESHLFIAFDPKPARLPWGGGRRSGGPGQRRRVWRGGISRRGLRTWFQPEHQRLQLRSGPAGCVWRGSRVWVVGENNQQRSWSTTGRSRARVQWPLRPPLAALGTCLRVLG